MRKTIGTNPLDAVVPDLTQQKPASKSRKSSASSGEKPRRPVKERLTIHIPVPLIERAKNTVYWTPGLTLADLGEQALEALVSEFEKKNGGPFEQRPHELRGGRPLK